MFVMVFIKGSWYDLGWFWIVEMGVWFFVLGVVLILLVMVVLC